jgi:hypothetical protein
MLSRAIRLTTQHSTERERERERYLISAAMPGRPLKALHRRVPREPLRILCSLRETLYVPLFLLCSENNFPFLSLSRETCLRLSIIYLCVRRKRTFSLLAATAPYIRILRVRSKSSTVCGSSVRLGVPRYVGNPSTPASSL